MIQNISFIQLEKILGIDEVNYSPSLAGDCIVCAYYALEYVDGVKDSKQLTHKQQLELFRELQNQGIYSVVPAIVNHINRINIYEARNWAIVGAINQISGILSETKHIISKVIIDGYWSKIKLDWFEAINSCLGNVQVEGCIKGDELVYEISAASIIARVYADALFEGWGKYYPGYNLEKNHGSPDKVMYKELKKARIPPVFRQGIYGKEWWKRILG